MQNLKQRPRVIRGTIVLERAETSAEATTIMGGAGACTLCSCQAYDDDGSGFSRCKCGDRKMDHS